MRLEICGAVSWRFFIFLFFSVGRAINHYEQGRYSETENSALRGIFGPKREEGIGAPENCIMIVFVNGTLHLTGDYMKVRWVKARDTNGRNEKRMQVYFENLEGKRLCNI